MPPFALAVLFVIVTWIAGRSFAPGVNGTACNLPGAPVTFRCEGKADGTGTLARSVDDFSATQPTPSLSSNTPLLANNVVGCDFTVTTTANLQTGVVGLSLALGRSIAGGNGNGNGVETVTLVDQIHVDNTP